MRIADLSFRGVFEEDRAESAEELQLLVPERDLETELLSWAILPQPETVEEDSARRGYVFHYQLGAPLDRKPGLFALQLRCRDASGHSHAVEIAAALTLVLPAQPGKLRTFTPMWLLSRRVHFRPLEGKGMDEYRGRAFGHLLFGGAGNLPHRRLFGAAV